MKKTLAMFLSSLLIVLVIGYSANLGKADPYLFNQVPFPVTPPSDVQSPSISIISPEDNGLLTTDNITLDFNVSMNVPAMPELFYYYLSLSDVYYIASWLPNSTHLDLSAFQHSIPPQTRTFSNDSLAEWGTPFALSGYELNQSFSVKFTDVPSGSHSIMIFAVESGSRLYSKSGIEVTSGTYTLSTQSIVHFSVHRTALLSPKNVTYSQADVPLLLNSDNGLVGFSYLLDGKESVAIYGNTTLNGLSNGFHNITVYARDEAGNVGVSETVSFKVEAFPYIAVAAIVAVILVSVSAALFYFKMRGDKK